MERWIAVPIAVGLCLTAARCGEERPAETTREGQAEAAEERRRVREEIIEDHRELHERIRQLPPEERQRLHEELHRDMMREMEGAYGPGGGPQHEGAQPHQPPGPQHPHGSGQGMSGAAGVAPDSTR